MAAKVESIIVGPIQNNVYIVSDAKGVLLIDPGSEPKHIMEALDGRDVDLIAITHAHFDHIGVVGDLQKATGAKVAIGEFDASDALGDTTRKADGFDFPLHPFTVDRLLADGDVVQVGDMEFEVMHTPGHTRGGICLYDAADRLLFSGDTLFYGSYGRTDFTGGSDEQMRASLKRLATLPDETIVYPGHGPKTSIGFEKRTDPWMR